MGNPLGEAEEAEGAGGLPVVHLRHFTPAVFLHILNYVYTESVNVAASS